MSAISPSSASLSAVQSLVSTSIAIPVCQFRGCGRVSSTRTPRARARTPCSGHQAVSSEEDAQLGTEAPGGVHVELVGQPEDLLADVQKHRRVAPVLHQELL